MKNYTTTDKYLDQLDKPEKEELIRIRAIVKEMVPEAVETISYGMPGFKYKGKYLLGYAAFKEHLSLFPTSVPIEELKGKLKDFKIAKGTIQFTLNKPIPDDLIREIVGARLKQLTN
jgi:uncharacterized protein YdhG (YjbR/CyaY superfamily)